MLITKKKAPQLRFCSSFTLFTHWRLIPIQKERSDRRQAGNNAHGKCLKLQISSTGIFRAASFAYSPRRKFDTQRDVNVDKWPNAKLGTDQLWHYKHGCQGYPRHSSLPLRNQRPCWWTVSVKLPSVKTTPFPIWDHSTKAFSFFL